MRLLVRLFTFGLMTLLPLAGCHELGHVDSPGTSTTTAGELVGEVQFVDASARQIELRTDAGRTWSVGYDTQTRVIYRQRNHPVSNLEAGDYVALRTRQDRDGRLYTDSISVRESAQDRGYSGAIRTVRGTVLRTDTRYNSVLLETTDRQQTTFTWDTQTRIRYRNRDYGLQNLQAGDQITVRMRDANQLAELITVNVSAQEKASTGGATNRMDRFEGTVEFIDSRRGQFEVRDRNNRLVVVNLLYNPVKSVADRFNRLRNGDFVRIEGRFINQDRFELETFL